MSRLRITRLGHGGVLYQSPGDKWVWVDRWSGAPTTTSRRRSHGRSMSWRPPTATSTTSATTRVTSWTLRAGAAR